MPSKEPLRCMIYCRVSTSQQELAGTSLDTQEAECITRAKAEGWTLIGPPVRERWSGVDLWQRKKLEGIREMIRSRQIDVLLCYDLDRLSRKESHVAIIYEECERAGVRLVFVTHEFDDTATGRMVRNVYSFAAELEREKTKERSWRAIKSQANAGRRLSGPRPRYGYQWADVTLADGKVWTKARLIEDPSTGPVVRRVYQMARDGIPTRKIAMTLSAQGIPTPKGGSTWTHTVIRMILKDRLYTGDAVAFRYQTATKLDTKRDRSHGEIAEVTERTKADPERIELPEGTVERLIDPISFDTVQARLIRTKAETAGKQRHPEAALLRTGFALCGTCGARLIVFQRGNGVIGYRCPRGRPDGETCPQPASMSAHLLDNIVWNRVTVAVSCDDDRSIAAEVERQLCKPTTVDAEIATIEASIGRVSRERSAIARQVAKIAIEVGDEEAADSAAAPLRTRLIELSKQSAELDRELTARKAIRDRRGEAEEWLRTLRSQLGRVGAAMESLDYKGRRDLLDLLGVSVRLYRADHDPRYEIEAKVDLSRWAWVDTLKVPVNDDDPIDLSRAGELRPKDVTPERSGAV